MSVTFCRARTIREGFTSSAHIDRDRSSSTTNASLFCSTFCGNFSQVGPARPTVATVREPSIKPRSHCPDRVSSTSNSTGNNSLLIALCQAEPERVRRNQNHARPKIGTTAKSHSGRMKWNSSIMTQWAGSRWRRTISMSSNAIRQPRLAAIGQ